MQGFSSERKTKAKCLDLAPKVQRFFLVLLNKKGHRSQCLEYGVATILSKTKLSLDWTTTLLSTDKGCPMVLGARRIS